MILFLHGPDTFRLHERVHALRDGFVKKYDAAGLSLEVLPAAEISADSLPSKLLSNGLFSSKRCIVLTDVFSLSESAAPVLLDLLLKLTNDTVLIMTAVELPKADSELKSALLATKHIETFPLLADTQLSTWVKQRLQQARCTVEPAALHYLVHAIGSDLWRMHAVIEQLAHYHPTITLADAELFVSSPLDDNIFHLTDALSERQPQQALRLLHDQLDSGANPFYILTMLARQFTILLQVKAGGEAAAALHPYVQKKAAQHAQRFSAQQLTDLFGKITAADLKLKTTSLEPVMVLDQLVAQLTLT